MAESQQKKVSIFRYTKWIHFIGFGFCLSALYIGGIKNPDIFFAVAIGIVTLLSINKRPLQARPEILDLIQGGVTKGGMYQGAFIKAMFGTALLYTGLYPFLFAEETVEIFSLILGSALLISSGATVTEAHVIGEVISDNS